MWLKYCPLIGPNSYELLTNFTNEVDDGEHFFSTIRQVAEKKYDLLCIINICTFCTWKLVKVLYFHQLTWHKHAMSSSSYSRYGNQTDPQLSHQSVFQSRELSSKLPPICRASYKHNHSLFETTCTASHWGFQLQQPPPKSEIKILCFYPLETQAYWLSYMSTCKWTSDTTMNTRTNSQDWEQDCEMRY